MLKLPKLAAALCLAPLALAGCEAPLSEGLVIRKRFDPAHDETRVWTELFWASNGCLVPISRTEVEHLPDRHLVTVNRYGRATEIRVAPEAYALAEVGKHQSFRDGTCRTLPRPTE